MDFIFSDQPEDQATLSYWFEADQLRKAGNKRGSMGELNDAIAKKHGIDPAKFPAVRDARRRWR
ncbi:hypothetical protein LB519_11875 [Mesorhizobium sp. AD1-1]|uniref:hypothetical protein n=1 Tax=Mesorhizobium sp. AD1-1 TaxID=2876621 RepID=UPI001CCD91D3|nr:hypothetical protein [Mesorhizobium sp. AD1-1]MBZ9718550.1 hypothetical protein [Mesorhizobium sp. AD1-1]